MSDAARFVPTDDATSHRGVEIRTGTDRLTGVAVRLFEFTGSPRGAPERLDHPNLPGVLALDRDGDRSRIAILLARDYGPLTGQTLSASQVRAAAAGLAALHSADIVHGGIGPERVRVGPDGHVLIEGGGAAWTAGDGRVPTQQADVRALASLLVAHAPGLPSAQRIVLEDAAEGAGADDGIALSVALNRAAANPVTRPATAGDEADEADDPASGDAATGNPATDGSTADTAAPRREPDRTAGGTVIKDLPPGGVYRSGEITPGDRPPAPPPRPEAPSVAPRARLSLPRPAIVLGVVAVVAVAVAWGLRSRDAGPPTGQVDPSFVIDVRVSPDDAPPLEIVVVRAPSASQLLPGAGLGRAPRRVQLDAPGRWVLAGRFADRATAPVDVTLPGADVVTLILPPDDTP